MDDDYTLWTLSKYVQDQQTGISAEDSYVTNRPRVLASKVISILSGTDLVVRVPDHTRQNKEVKRANDALEALNIGILGNVDRRLRRIGEPGLQAQLAWHATVRSWKVAARGLLRKRANGETYEEILPLDPRFLYIEMGDEEPIWSAYQMWWTRSKIRDRFPKFKFEDESIEDGDEVQTVYDYWIRSENPDYNPISEDAFERSPWRYENGVLVDGRWALPLTNRFCLSFPVVAVAVDQMPGITTAGESQPADKNDRSSIQDQGESIFADNRTIWDKKNRAISYLMSMMAKQSDPPKLIKSIDGETVLDGSMNRAGDVVPLSEARSESVELMQQADLLRAGVALLDEIRTDETAGGLAPQGLGIIDTALSSVALRQLGTNMEHKIAPRLMAMQEVISGCLENIVKQFESGGFEPITVSGRRNDNTHFSSVILPEDLDGHDNITISLKFEAPQSDMLNIQAATQLMQLTPAGESLGSLPYVRTKYLNMESSDIISAQNAEAQMRASTPLAQAWQRYEAAKKTGDEPLIAIALDALRLQALQHSIQVEAGITQLLQAKGQLPPISEIQPEDTLNLDTNGSRQYGNNEDRNPANGAPPFVLSTGIGNEPSPDAGNNLGLPRNTTQEPQLVGPNGLPISTGGF